MNKLIYIIATCICTFLLASCSGDEKEKMLGQLAELERQNLAYESMTNDTLAKELVGYFEHHGTSNERMRAHYMLGCTYRDMGESPLAVLSFQDAIAQADTTATDCDLRTLCSIYSQLGWMFHCQLLLTDEIAARSRSQHFAEKLGNMWIAISEKKLSAGVYTLLNKPDSAEAGIREVIQLYRKHGYEQDAIQAYTMLMFLYVDKPDSLDALKRLIDQFDQKCTLFDERHELVGAKKQFYYYKGKYFEGIGRLDSAEYYYRKLYYPAMPFTMKEAMYKGLLGVFQKHSTPDSVFKYAQLCCEVNDSSITLKDRELVAQMTASYNYNNYQQQARMMEKKMYTVSNYLILATALLVVCVLLFLSYYWRSTARMRANEARMMAYDQIVKKAESASQEVSARHDASRKSLVNSALRLRLIEQASDNTKCAKATEDDWRQMEKEINDHYPGFSDTLRGFLPGINTTYYRICLGVKFQLSPLQIASLIARSHQTIASARSRMYAKAFGKKGSTANFDEFIANIA